MFYPFGFNCCVQLDPDDDPIDHKLDEEFEFTIENGAQSQDDTAQQSNSARSGAETLEGLMATSYADITRRQRAVYDEFEANFKALQNRRKKLFACRDRIKKSCEERADTQIKENSTTLTLNVGGKIFNINRSAHSLNKSDYSILNVLLSGEWDLRLPRDHNGRIFLNIDPAWIEPALALLKVDCSPKPPITDENMEGFNTVVSYYNLNYLFQVGKLDLPEASSIDCMNLPTCTDSLVSFLHDEMSPKEHSESMRLELLYRGSRDGIEPSDFHSRCDGMCNTVCVVESSAGYVFGGYAEGAWMSCENDLQTKKSFLFSLNGLGAPEKFPRKLSSQQSKILNRDQYLFFFGIDLTVAGNDKTVSRLGTMYSSNSREKAYLAGDEKFLVKEIEVYQIVENVTHSKVSRGASFEVNEKVKLSRTEPLQSWITTATNHGDKIAKCLSDMSGEIDLAERKLLIELLWVEHLSTPPDDREASEGLLADWQSMIDDALQDVGNGVDTLDIVEEAMVRLNITDSDDEMKNAEYQEFSDKDEVVSYSVGGEYISILRSTLTRHASSSAFTSRFTGRRKKDLVDGNVFLVSEDPFYHVSVCVCMFVCVLGAKLNMIIKDVSITSLHTAELDLRSIF
jgi:TLD